MSVYYRLVWDKYTNELVLLEQRNPELLKLDMSYSALSQPTKNLADIVAALVKEINDLRGSLRYIQERE